MPVPAPEYQDLVLRAIMCLMRFLHDAMEKNTLSSLRPDPELHSEAEQLRSDIEAAINGA
jgi:hypothetical protein